MVLAYPGCSGRWYLNDCCHYAVLCNKNVAMCALIFHSFTCSYVASSV